MAKTKTEISQIVDPQVAAVFASYPMKLQQRVKQLRQLILNTALDTPGVGKLEETLKWNEPAYLTTESKSGSTIRIGRVAGNDSKYAIYFNCRTHLVDSFRTMFPQSFRYQGNRSIEFDIGDKVPIEELKICISMALTYHTKRSNS